MDRYKKNFFSLPAILRTHLTMERGTGKGHWSKQKCEEVVSGAENVVGGVKVTELRMKSGPWRRRLSSRLIRRVLTLKIADFKRVWQTSLIPVYKAAAHQGKLICWRSVAIPNSLLLSLLHCN